MFLHLSVSHSVHRGACVAGGVHGRGQLWRGGVCDQGVCVWPGGMHGWGCALRGACMVGTCMTGDMRGRGVCVAGETATATGGKHPTGMHSCCGSFYC